MKTPSVAALALAAIHARDPLALERTFHYLTPPALAQLDGWMQEQQHEQHTAASNHHHVVVAQAVVRRIVHKCLDKYASLLPYYASSPHVVEAALQYHTLPVVLQQTLLERYGGDRPPTTWYEALQRLRKISSSNSELWRLVLEHPMTSYVPMQCPQCGLVVPDEYSTAQEDAKIGLTQEEATGDELELRGGWFRGRPRPPEVFVLDCPKCQTTSKWYRSGHPQILLNPNKWGRLCGEQEDLRFLLAQYLNIPLRTCIPLDWDHVWSEFGCSRHDDDDDNNNDSCNNSWEVVDESARNFAVRLDEGIGSWTGVWAMHPTDPQLCQDVTDEYLSCRRQNSSGGRADEPHAFQMGRYRDAVAAARQDPTAASTQAKTLNGHVLHRAYFSSQRITAEMRRAAKEYGHRGWWQVLEEEEEGT